jgi:kinesin family protein 3/17
MLELYNEEIADLLSSDQNKKLQIHENKDKGVYVKDLTSYPVTTVDEMRRKLKEGSGNRHVGSTEMNRDSSRSHSIFIVRVEQEE